MICACIKQNKVVGILKFETEDEYADMAHEFELMIDCSNYSIMPQIDYEYVPELDQFNYGQLNIHPSVKISKLSFRKRFTDAEKVLIKGLARQNTVSGYLMDSNLDDQRDSSFIDLKRPDTIAGVMSLVPALLTSDRAAAILNTPPTYDEMYKG